MASPETIAAFARARELELDDIRNSPESPEAAHGTSNIRRHIVASRWKRSARSLADPRSEEVSGKIVEHTWLPSPSKGGPRLALDAMVARYAPEMPHFTSMMTRRPFRLGNNPSIQTEFSEAQQTVTEPSTRHLFAG